MAPAGPVIQGALTYEKDIALLNAVFPDCVTTGGETEKDGKGVRNRYS